MHVGTGYPWHIDLWCCENTRYPEWVPRRVRLQTGGSLPAGLTWIAGYDDYSDTGIPSTSRKAIHYRMPTPLLGNSLEVVIEDDDTSATPKLYCYILGTAIIGSTFIASGPILAAGAELRFVPLEIDFVNNVEQIPPVPMGGGVTPMPWGPQNPPASNAHLGTWIASNDK
jgi:hypothetical protein